jgi:hypothetical protein
MSFPTEAASGIKLSIINKLVARTLIQKPKITLHIAGGAGIDSTNKARARPETKALKMSEKNCEAERP